MRELRESKERISTEKMPESTEKLLTSINVRLIKEILISSNIVKEKAKKGEEISVLKNSLKF